MGSCCQTWQQRQAGRREGQLGSTTPACYSCNATAAHSSHSCQNQTPSSLPQKLTGTNRMPETIVQPKKTWKMSVSSNALQRGEVSQLGVSSQGSGASRDPFLTAKTKIARTAERWGTRCAPPQTCIAPRLRAGMPWSTQGDRHCRESNWSSQGKVVRAWKHQDPSGFGSWACSAPAALSR